MRRPCSSPASSPKFALANETTEAYEAARRAIADFIGAASTAEIVFTKATDAIGSLASSFGAADLREGDEIVIRPDGAPRQPSSRGMAPARTLVQQFDSKAAIDMRALETVAGPRTALDRRDIVDQPGTVKSGRRGSPIKRHRAVGQQVRLSVDGAQAVVHTCRRSSP